jgi:hypothetical protein
LVTNYHHHHCHDDDNHQQYWNVFEETQQASTGLKLHQVTDEVILLALDGTDPTEADAGNIQLDRWQPDFTLISRNHKQIAVLALT